jgi:hypothetical protein
MTVQQGGQAEPGLEAGFLNNSFKKLGTDDDSTLQERRMRTREMRSREKGTIVMRE